MELNKNTDGYIIIRKNMELPRFKAGLGKKTVAGQETINLRATLTELQLDGCDGTC